jgi:ADP-heptose:LPS heptosyltransferase
VNKLNKKILFCTGEGIGNVVQTIPVIRTIKEVLGYEIDFWHAFGSFKLPKMIPYVDRWVIGNEIFEIDPAEYVGKVSTFWAANYLHTAKVGSLKLLNKIIPLSMDRSEVDTYMQIARDLGVKEKDLIWHGECDYIDMDYEADVIIHNGYNPHGAANWQIKSYPYYAEVASMLYAKGIRVASVGTKSEYVDGTFDITDRSLLKTLGIIRRTKVFLGNDSGLYHCANALRTPNVVIFTATSVEKNYDKKFHRYATIIGRNDLDCRPCQANKRWNKDCKTWECRNIKPKIVFDYVKNMLWNQ